VWRRGCLYGCGGLLILCVVALGLGYFIGLPRVQDAIADDIGDGISTVVSDGIVGLNPSSGEFVITEQQLNEKLTSDVNNADVTTQIDPSGVAIEFSYRDDNSDPIRYSAVPSVDDNGHFVLNEVQTTNGNGLIERFLPKDKLADSIENGVNGALDAENLKLSNIDLQDGQIVLTTVSASQ
jgi:hypothetical protein